MVGELQIGLVAALYVPAPVIDIRVPVKAELTVTRRCLTSFRRALL